MGVLTEAHLHDFDRCNDPCEVTDSQIQDRLNQKHLFPLAMENGLIVGIIQSIDANHVTVDLTFLGRALESDKALDNTQVRFTVVDDDEILAEIISTEKEK